MEIHHIIPQEENGPDTEDNAAPLCGTCHNKYGANPEKRKRIRECRDLWYELCAKRFTDGTDKLEVISDELKTITADVARVARSSGKIGEVDEKVSELKNIVTADSAHAVARSQQGEFRFVGGPFEGKQPLAVREDRGVPQLPEFLGMPVTCDHRPVTKKGERVWGCAMYHLVFDGQEVTYVFLRFEARDPDASTPVKLCSNLALAEELAKRAHFWGLIISSPSDRTTPPVAGDPIVSHSKLDARQQLQMIESLLPELRRRALFD